MTLREELLKIQKEVRAKYAKQKEAEAAQQAGQLSRLLRIIPNHSTKSAQVNCPTRSASSQVGYFCSNPFKLRAGQLSRRQSIVPNQSIKFGRVNCTVRSAPSQFAQANCPAVKALKRLLYRLCAFVVITQRLENSSELGSMHFAECFTNHAA